MANNRYCIDLAKRGTAGCKNCKTKIDKGLVRIAKIIPNPFTDEGGDMKEWYHVRCIFDKLSRARATTKKIESTDDLEGWDEIADEHKPDVLKCIEEFASATSSKKSTPKKTPAKKAKKAAEKEVSSDSDDDTPNDDDTFLKFHKLCDKVAKTPEYTRKTAILSDFFTNGSDGSGFKGNLYLWVKMLLPAVEKRVYNLQTKQLINIFATIFEASPEEMQEDLEKGGDVSETIKQFCEQSEAINPAKGSTLYLQDVDKYLDRLASTGLEVEQTNILTQVTKRCTGEDLKYFIRLIKHDLRMKAGPKPVLQAIHPTAYEAFQSSRDLKDIVKRSQKFKKKGNTTGTLTAQASLMTPVLPMLAQACKDLKTPFTKYPKGFYVEVKYDGERVQLHKSGSEFSYFSRSLKPVMPHKVMHFKEYIPKAFPHGNDMILDCEILLVNNDGKPLPFGTLGAHKKTAFTDASVCLFVFDCLHFNNENIMNKPLFERRSILEENMKPIKNHVMFSELKDIKSPKQLNEIVTSVIKQGLEGIVIKSKDGVYEPGKRHWLKLKKDYLTKADGKGMADSADLVVLGGYYGTGRKGGKMSVFLMGCYDSFTDKWKTVTKVPGGSDEMLDKLQDDLDMVKIGKDQYQVPSWLSVNKALIPDFVIANPKKAPVWEISGAEFSQSEVHTANGISIRFPRIAKVRDDKNWKTATNLKELQDLFDASRVKSEIIGLKTASDDDDNNDDNPGTSGRNISFSFGEDQENNKGASKKTKRKDDDSEIDMKPKHVKKEHRNFESDASSAMSNSEKWNRKHCDNATPKKAKREQDEDVKRSSKNMKVEKSSGSSSNKCDGSPSLQGLPNIFSGVGLYIPQSVADYDTLKRYFIAYDGRLLSKHEMNQSSHVIVPSKERLDSVPKEAKQISADWLWDSIKLQRKLDTKLYRTT